jgi:hypothetical protein
MANITVTGGGIIDGRGLEGWMQAYTNSSCHKSWWPPYLSTFDRIDGLLIRDITFLDPGMATISLGGIDKAELDRVNITARWFRGPCQQKDRRGLCEPPNTDAIDVNSGSKDIHIHDSFISIYLEVWSCAGEM